MTEQVNSTQENDSQEKPTLQQAREYLERIISIAGDMAKGTPLKDNITDKEVWATIHRHLGNVDRLIEIAQEQLREV
ncbi:hypothetical protein BKG95_05225 [Rodentibacter pneumotropicus]|uniref:Uncharacterized protein n=1 Tax=Rodentibacter pneumotropicus TaxID=758 RepID=A0AAW5LDV0_9PAST|nr:hypothetical protein [Rodentibacter pneumotropicus]MCQ9121934.1 hypothetical protein [Rodentibacter pneumotropicus]OOF68114.1 hypothetical protein BKG95_05225 [Rodentibacter pneumotropicus]